ncbi:MAG: HAD family hydrolase [Phycisphaerae bacterium]
MSLDGLFLDLYGTLTAGDRAAVEAVCAEIVHDTGLDCSAPDLSIAWGTRFFAHLDNADGDGFLNLFDVEIKTLTETMSDFKTTIDPRPYCERLREYWRNPPLQPEARAFLTDFPHPVCLVSNADQADAEAVMSRHNLPIDRIVTSEITRSYKPDRRIFDHALDVTGWRRDRVIHVGDSLHSDVGGAIAAGLRSGWLNRAHRIHDIGQHKPDHEFKDLNGLADWVRQF